MFASRGIIAAVGGVAVALAAAWGLMKPAVPPTELPAPTVTVRTVERHRAEPVRIIERNLSGEASTLRGDKQLTKKPKRRRRRHKKPQPAPVAPAPPTVEAPTPAQEAPQPSEKPPTPEPPPPESKPDRGKMDGVN